jgi:hypothetical protein
MQTDISNAQNINEIRIQKSNTLNEYITKPISVDGKKYSFLLDPGNRKGTPLKSYARGYLDTFGWFAASKAEKTTTELLYETASPENNDAVEITLPSQAGFATLMALLLDEKSSRDLFLVGARGSGKSLAQNKFINLHLEDINKKGFTYFRTDIGKLHTFNHQESMRLSQLHMRMSIQEYMALHAFNVVLSHGDAKSIDPGLVRFQSDHNSVKEPSINRLRELIKHTEFAKFLNLQENEGEHLVAAWESIAVCFSGRGADPKKKNENLYTYLRLCRETPKLTVEIISKLFEQFMIFVTSDQEIRSKNIIGAKVILMVDGVDNLRTDDYKIKTAWVGGKPSGQWYQLYLADLRLMLNGGGITKHANKSIYALRPDTHAQIKAGFEVVLTHGENDYDRSINTLLVSPPNCLKMIDTKRLAAIKDPGNSKFILSTNFDIVKSDAYKAEVPLLHELFECFVLIFFNVHINSLKRCGIAAVNYDDVQEFVFNNNVRSLERNLIRTFDAVYDYVKLVSSWTDYDQVKRIDKFRKLATPIVLEFSIAGGNAYFVQNSDDEANGRWCPNIFEFEDVANSSRWDGLVLLRVLQALPAIYSDDCPLSKNDIEKALAKFGYPALQVEYAIWTAGDFGLIRTEKTTLGENNEPIPEFTKTKKGEYIQKLVFNNHAALYLMATGMRGIGFHHENDGKLPHMRSNHWLHDAKAQNSQFWPAVIKSSAHLLRHIQSAHLRDMNYFLQSHAQLENKFAIPDLTVIIKSLSRQAIIVSTRQNQKTSIDSVFNFFNEQLKLP